MFKKKNYVLEDKLHLDENDHEANIRGGGKTVHVVFKYLYSSLS